MTEPGVVVLEIMGRPLTIRSSMPPERLRAVAALVREQLKELERAFPASPLADLAILAALNLASDYLDLQDDHEQLRAEIESKSRNLIQRLERHGSRSTAGG